MTKPFYTRNSFLVDNPAINLTFYELRQFDEDQLWKWMENLCDVVVDAWDNHGIPPVVGFSEEEIEKQFREMRPFPVHEFLVADENGSMEYIRNTSRTGTAVNAFFPTMMKTRINYTLDHNKGKSIYDWFARKDLRPRLFKYIKRNFFNDSFYHYSETIEANSIFKVGNVPFNFKDGNDFKKKFEEYRNTRFDNYDYWLEEPSTKDKEYTGYNPKLIGKKYIQIDGKRVRLYNKSKRLFPEGLKSFRITFAQYAVNYPPLTAKYLYERFTEDLKDQDIINIWDPSAGWGGRIIGAMAVKSDRNIHYIGNDPNLDHSLEGEYGPTKYHALAKLYNEWSNKGVLFPHYNTYEIYQLGSEEMQYWSEFQKYKGELDLVFTSPPYFSKEAYADQDSQSYKKFVDYEKWRDKFLYETLKTAVEWLRPNRYLLWNIADVEFGNTVLPLEQDSIDILESLGMEYQYTLKMTLSQMPGGNRVSDGKPTARNACKINGIWLKYEPVYIFWKPHE